MPSTKPVAVALVLALVLGLAALPGAVAATSMETRARSADAPASRTGSGERSIVLLRPGTSADGFLARADSLGVRPTGVFRHATTGFAARLTPAQRAALERHPDVVAVRPDRLVELADQRLPPGIDRVEADRSALAAIDGVNLALDVDIAIIDTGIDPDHPDLNVAGGHSCVTSSTANWRDEHGHGTHVAGTAAARDNGIGVVGVAPGARVWAVRVFDDVGDGAISWESAIVCGLDWVAAQRDPSDPSRPRFEVANMSLRSGGADDGACGSLNADAMHRALCGAVARGVTVVVAAGNDADNAARYIPAAYDEAITVSALADYDGRPGGNAAVPDQCDRSRPDDRFANFSNYGHDVDLIAPGACVQSTIPGGRYARMSGTSMAAPTVAGGAALYKVLYPNASPEAVRGALVRAGVRDWITATDPDGVAEPLLDVSAFAVVPNFSLSASPPSLMRAPGEVARYRIAIGREAGFSGSIEWLVSGLPPRATASVTPDPSSGSSREAVLEVRLPDEGTESAHAITVQGSSQGMTRSASVQLLVQPGVAGVAGSPQVGFRGSPAGRFGLPIHVSWPAVPGATAYRLQVSVAEEQWKDVPLGSSTSTALETSAWPSLSYRYRVRALRNSGWQPWLMGRLVTAVPFMGPNPTDFAGGWTSYPEYGTYSGRPRYSRQRGATATLEFTGRQVAWISTRAPDRGRARVYVDGALAATIDLRAANRQYRQIVFRRSWATAGRHTITIEVLGTHGRPRVDVDAIPVLRER